MEFKGTKGKWRHSKGTVSIWHPSNTLERVASVDYKWLPTEEDYANAQLIAHAPEMLEMLQMWCMDMEERGRAYGDCYTMTKELIKSATEL